MQREAFPRSPSTSEHKQTSTAETGTARAWAAESKVFEARLAQLEAEATRRELERLKGALAVGEEPAAQTGGSAARQGPGLAGAKIDLTREMHNPIAGANAGATAAVLNQVATCTHQRHRASRPSQMPSPALTTSPSKKSRAKIVNVAQI